MSFDISLSAGMRSDLISLQGTAALLNRTQGRLSSGKQVNSAVDDPSKYFAAADHVNHASDLTARKSDMGEAIQAVKAANLGVTAITSLINQAQSLVQTARSSTIAARAALAKQFNDYRDQIDQQAADSGYNGKNFLQNDTLDVLFNETGTSKLTVVGFSGDALGLGITTAAFSTGVAHTGEALALSGVAAAATLALKHSGSVQKADITLTQTLAVAESANVGTAQSTLVGVTLASKSAGALTHVGEVLRSLTAGDYTFEAEALSTETAGALSNATAEVLLSTAAAFSAKDQTITLAHNGIDSNVNVYETVKFSGTITAGATAGSIHGVITISAAHHASALANVVVKSAGSTMTAGQYSKTWSGDVLKITLTTAHVGAVTVGITSFNRTLVSGAAADYTRTSGTAVSPGQITFNNNLSGIVKVDYGVPTTITSGGSMTLAHKGAATISRVYQQVSYHQTAAIKAGDASAGRWQANGTVTLDTPNMSAQDVVFNVMAGTLKLKSGVDFTATLAGPPGKWTIDLLHKQYTAIDVSFTYTNTLQSGGTDFTQTTTGDAQQGAKLTFDNTIRSGVILVDYKVANTVLSGQTLTLSNKGPADNVRIYQSIAFTQTAAIASADATSAEVALGAAGDANITFGVTMTAAPKSFTVKAGNDTDGFTTLKSGEDYTATFAAGQVTIQLLTGQGGDNQIDVSFTYEHTLTSGDANDYTRTTGNATTGATITFNGDFSGTIKADYKASNTVISGQTITLANKGPASNMKLYQEIAYTKTAAIAATDATNAKIAAGAAKFTVTPTMSAAPATITVMAGTKALTAGVSYTATLSAGQLTISLLQAQTKSINVSLTYDKTLVSGVDYTRTSGTATQGAQITFNDNLSGAIKADYQVVNPVQSGRTITLQHAGAAAKVNVYQEISYTKTAAISSANASVPNINAGLATFTVTPTMAAKPATITVMAGTKQLTAGHSYSANFNSGTGALTISLLQAQTTHIDVSFTYDKQLTSGVDYTRTTGGPKTAAQILLTQTFSGEVKVSYEVTNTVDTGDYTVSSGSTTTAGAVTFNKALSGTVQATYSVNKTLWGDNTAIEQDADKLNAAISKLRSQASSMAANLSVITTRQDWSAGMISNLQTGSDNLTLADMNEEGANMLALQTRQQLGIQALSLASQANQSIMRLFG